MRLRTCRCLAKTYTVGSDLYARITDVLGSAYKSAANAQGDQLAKLIGWPTAAHILKRLGEIYGKIRTLQVSTTFFPTLIFIDQVRASCMNFLLFFLFRCYREDCSYARLA